MEMVTYYWFPEPCNTCVALKQHLTVTNPVRNQKLLQRVCGLLNGRLVMWIQAESAATNKNVQSNLSYPDSCYPGTLPQPGSRFSLFYADLAEILGSTVGVACYSLYYYIYTVF